MGLNAAAAKLFQGFSKLTHQQRLERLLEMGALTPDDLKILAAKKNLSTHLAEQFIENVIGYFQIPLGVATNFRIDGQDRVVPMAVEETSIIAALSKTAKWIRQSGHITTHISGDTIIGQVQLAKVKDFEATRNIIECNKSFLMNSANQHPAQSLFKRGGGVKDITVRKIPRGDGYDMAVIHIFADPCDAMGANMMIQICEYLKDPIQQLTQESVTMCILSNLNDSKLVKAEVLIENIDPDIGHKLSEASLFAECDPYRAATNNKGVLNGIDPVLIATGNDWRAVEAGIHAYAARSGQYRSITQWTMKGKDLIGKFEAPLDVGVVGGVTKLHPMAQMSLRMLDIQHASELARIAAAVGLVQNLGALRALITLGFTEGHMKLHITNLTLSAGAKAEEIPLLRKKLEEFLASSKRITESNAIEILKELRQQALAFKETLV
ncbi:MAG: hydroxymethylglutaryl-CoA reductase, degradative [Proteobacteria bacterium]|nr:hydroxymethylglutaryl-CoA reductase, degradative [Pseudomonadota bacterium]